MEITIAGPCGAGKTSLALWLRQWLEAAGVTVVYTNPDAPEASRSFLPPQELEERVRARIARAVTIREVA